MLKKLAAISLAAGALVLIAPVAASAAPSDLAHTASDYAGTPDVTLKNPIIDICETSTIVFGAGYFLPGEKVGVSISGANAAGASVSGDTAAGDGSLVLSFAPPSNGEGSYTLAFSAAQRSYAATVTVTGGGNVAGNCEDDPGVVAAGMELPLSSELALTGGNISPWIVGGGAVALAAGGALVVAGAARRRRS